MATATRSVCCSLLRWRRDRIAARAAAQSWAARVHTAAHTCCTCSTSEAVGHRPKSCRTAWIWAVSVAGLQGGGEDTRGAGLQLRSPRSCQSHQSPTAILGREYLTLSQAGSPCLLFSCLLPYLLLHFDHMFQEDAALTQ